MREEQDDGTREGYIYIGEDSRRMCDSRNRGRRKKEERYAGEVKEKEEVQGIEEEGKRPR